jgi:hypothetical protein
VRLDPRILRIAQLTKPPWVVIDCRDNVSDLVKPKLHVRELPGDLMSVTRGETFELASKEGGLFNGVVHVVTSAWQISPELVGSRRVLGRS